MSLRSPACLRRLLQITAVFGVAAATVVSARAVFWKPVSPEEMALDHPRLDPETGVEILFRETEIDDSSEETTTTHTYVRLKVFNARGVAALDPIDIVEARDAVVSAVAARVIRPDGAIVEVGRDAIYSRVAVRRGWARRRMKSFSFPALEPGCIVEYQWNEESSNGIGGLQLYFQERFPTWQVQYRIRPFNYSDRRGYQLKTAGFRYVVPDTRPDHLGFYTFAQQDVPALHEEPWMPPDDMVQPWMVLYFLPRGQKADEYWRETARKLARDVIRRTRPSRSIENTARSVTAGLKDDISKLLHCAAFCRDEIKNLRDPASEPAAAVAMDEKQDRAAREILEAREGTPEEINLVFLALIRALGFEGRTVCVTDRSKRMFREPLPARFMLPDTIAAVRIAGDWRFFDPGSRHVAAGCLAWENEGVTALVCDRGHEAFVQTPRTPRAESRISRTARLALDEDGTATGLVVIEYRGHPAVEERHAFVGASPERRAALLYTAESARLPGLEIADVAVMQAENPDLPLQVSYRVRVPHYAAGTGSRLVFPLAYFQQGLPPVFTAAKREHVIYQPYEFVEHDSVEIILPAGYQLEDGAAPAGFALPPALEFRTNLTPSDTGDRLVYRRDVSQGGMLFPAKTYRLLKQAFDHLRRQDARLVIARRHDEP